MIFWDIFIARSKPQGPGTAESCSEGLDQFQTGLLQQQQSLMQSPQLSLQFQLQQQLLLQAQQNLASSSATDLDVPNGGLQVQVGSPIMLTKASKNQTGQKRKQPMSSSGLGSSSGTANTVGPSPSSAPSTPSTHTTGDTISMPSLPHTDGSSKPLYMLDDTGVGTLTSVENHSMHMDHFADDGSLDDNIESLLSRADANPDLDTGKGFTFSEIGSIFASTIDCFHFSLDGKLLATGGHDKKARLWCTDSREHKSTLDEHSRAITDIRFSPTMPQLATSSLDKTVRVWDVENPGYSVRTFIGHPASAVSLDFHPNKDDLICSCDDTSEIRYWSIKNSGCVRVAKGGAKQVRFQPSLGRYLAAVVGSTVSIID